MKSPASTVLAILLAASTWLAASDAGAQGPRYTLFRLEPLETPAGLLDQIRALDMNNRGQVVGRAHNGHPAGDAWTSAAFLYAPGTGMQDLDPDGAYRSRAEAVNDRGQVFGRVGAPSYVRDGQTRLFLYREGEGYDFLKSNRQIRTTFVFRDMNNAGEIVGGVVDRDRHQYDPYLYSPGEGWIDLAALDPRLERRSVVATYVNDHGEIAFSDRRGSCGNPDWFVFDRRGALVALGLFCPDRYHALPAHVRRFSKTGQLLGSFIARRIEGEHATIARLHAQYYQRGKGKIDVHPQGFKASGSNLINDRGLIAGVLQEGRSRDTVFTFDERRQPKLRVELTPEDIRSFAGGDFSNVVLFDLNDKGEMIGYVNGADVWFHYSRETGPRNLRELFAEAGGFEDLMAVRRINNRGQILVLTALDGLSAPQPREWFQFDAPNRRDMITIVMSPVPDDGG